MWRKEAIHQEFKDATIIHLFKRKGNPQVCDNHRGISLLSIAGKILARVLLNRLNEHLERSGLLPESQCGFRKNRGTIDMIFTARRRPRWLSWMRRPIGDQEVAGSTPAEVGNILSWRLIMKYFLRSFSPFR